MAKGDINLFGKLVAGYDGPLTSAEQVAYEADGTGASFRTVHDEIEALKTQGGSSSTDIKALQEEVAKKANQTDLEATNGKVQTAQSTADAAKSAADKAQTTADAKVATVSGVTGNAVSVSTTNHTSSVSLKIDDSAAGKGNVTLTQSTNGLVANVSAATVNGLAKVQGVATGDNVLGLTDNLVSATVSLDYYKYPADHATKAGKQYIRLLGKNGVVLGEVDASDFLKDGMVNGVSFNEATKKLRITFNTDAGKEAIEVNLASLVDTYGVVEGGGLRKVGNNFAIDDTVATKTFVSEGYDTKGSAAGVKNTIDAYSINGHTLASKSIAIKGSEIEVGGTGSYGTSKIDAAIETLAGKVATVEGKAGVTSIDAKTGAFTLKKGQTGNGTINLSTGTGATANEISATIVGLKSAAFTDSTAYDKSGSAAGVKTELTKTIEGVSSSLHTDIETNRTNISNLDSYVKNVETTASANFTAAKAYADTASANAVKALGSATASPNQFVTAVNVSAEGKLGVTSAEVTATQVKYTKPTTAPATGTVANALYSVQNDIATIKGTGEGSIGSQIDAKIAAVSSSKSGSSNGVTVKVNQSAGKISGVTVTAPVIPTVASVTEAKTAADKAQTTADGAVTAAGKAQATADKAQETADEAKAAADAASSTAAETYVKKIGDEMSGNLVFVTGKGIKLGTCTITQTDGGDIEFEFA